MSLFDDVRSTLARCLQLGERANDMTPDTELLGSLPELDSMAVVTVILALEEDFDVTVEDDEINADAFETMGSLVTFVEGKLATQ